MFRRAVGVLSRVRWARVLLASAEIVDVEYVRAQLGRRVSPRAAILRYVWRGFQTGLRLNPLFVDEAVGDSLPGLHRVPALYAYLIADPAGVPAAPLWDAVDYLERHPQRATEPGGALGAAWRRREEEGIPFGSATHPLPATTLLLRMAAAADAARRGIRDDVDAAKPAVGGELIVALGDGEVDFDETLSEVAAYAASGQAVAIAVTSRRPEVWSQTTELALGLPRVRAILRPDADVDEAVRELIASTTAATAVIRGPDLQMSADAMIALGEAVADGSVTAPLWLDVDGTIAAAGAARDGRILAGHPAEDAAGLGDGHRIDVPSLSGRIFAGPISLLHGISAAPDPAAAAAAAARDRAAPVSVRLDLVARSRVPAPRPELPAIAEDDAALLRAAGWDLAGSGAGRIRGRVPVTATLADGTEVPVLRWALRTAAPAGPRGETWGDTHFARGLAAALHRLGQEAVVDAYPARSRPTASLDDVTLVLRGPEPIDPPAAGLRVMWVISHPDEVATSADLDGFDLVFAASAGWAARATERFGRPIRPLLQCTDPTRFRPAGVPRGDGILFVGTARGIYRPSVVEPIRAGVPVDVYGPDWRAWIPGARIRGTNVPNRDLPAMYEAAGVVLNDHWPAMQREGFIGNRLYDVVAAGGRAISDAVDGIAEVFDGAVLTYRSIDELVGLLTGDLDAAFPREEDLRRVAARVRERDSFDARARTLLDEVLRVR